MVMVADLDLVVLVQVVLPELDEVEAVAIRGVGAVKTLGKDEGGPLVGNTVSTTETVGSTPNSRLLALKAMRGGNPVTLARVDRTRSTGYSAAIVPWARRVARARITPCGAEGVVVVLEGSAMDLATEGMPSRLLVVAGALKAVGMLMDLGAETLGPDRVTSEVVLSSSTRNSRWEEAHLPHRIMGGQRILPHRATATIITPVPELPSGRGRQRWGPRSPRDLRTIAK